MSFRVHLALTTLALVALTGCGRGMAPASIQSDPDPQDRASGARATVLTSAQLKDESGSLLETMSRRLFNIRVDNRFSCPAISLRGSQNTVPGVTEPTVYVDGTRTVDTCILNLLNATDVARVEIYPMGFTSRPGYTTNSHGLILVFTRNR
jgi:hypothetical protein